VMMTTKAAYGLLLNTTDNAVSKHYYASETEVRNLVRRINDNRN